MSAAVFLLWVALTAAAAGDEGHAPGPEPTLDAPPAAVRTPDAVAIAAAGAAMVVAGGAGIWIYRVIRKGL